MDKPDRHLKAKIGQYGLVVNLERKVLLLERARSKDWSLPGGRLDKDERNWESAFSREIKEEVGVEAKDFNPFDVKIIEDEWQVKYCVYFLIKIDDTDSIKVSEEHSDYKWVNSEDIKDMKIDDEPKVREVLEKFFKNE